MDVANILDRAADLIEPEGAWTQGRYARDVNGRDATPEGTQAACWCILGALTRVGGFDINGYFGAKNVLYDLLGSSVVDWNDDPDRTQEEAVAKLREAALFARKNSESEL